MVLDAGVDPGAITDTFHAYMKAEGREITRAVFEESLDAKVGQPAFGDDITILLPPGTTFDVAAGAARVATDLIARLPGDRWKGRSLRRRERRTSGS